MNPRQVAWRLREQLARSSGICSPHFSKPQSAFIQEMIYGIQASQQVKVSCIGRALGEEIELKKTEARLSRHLKVPGIDQIINERIAVEAAPRLRADTLIVVDPTDIRKSYAERMEYLATVRDGSGMELVPGYWACMVVACEPGRRRVIPLHQRLWSAEASDFESENTELPKVIDTIRGPTEARGIYVMDRGGDRIKLFNPLLDRKLRFIIRLTGERDLICGRAVKRAEEWGRSCPMRYAQSVIKEELETEKKLALEYGMRPVKRPEREEQLCLVVVRGFGEEPLLLLTKCGAATLAQESVVDRTGLPVPLVGEGDDPLHQAESSRGKPAGDEVRADAQPGGAGVGGGVLHGGVAGRETQTGRAA